MTDKRTVTLRLPWPPSLNRIWRSVNNRVILSETARKYAAAAANALPPGRVEPLRGRLIVTMSLCPPAAQGAKKWDVANREKLVADILTKQRVWLDDEQVDTWLMTRGAPSEHGHVDILIQEY